VAGQGKQTWQAQQPSTGNDSLPSLQCMDDQQAYLTMPWDAAAALAAGAAAVADMGAPLHIGRPSVTQMNSRDGMAWHGMA
jgi:hypothetical protein